MRHSFAVPLMAAISVSFLFAASACSSKHKGSVDGVDPADGGGGLIGTDDGGGGFGSGADAGGGSGECNASTQSIYVVADDGNLYSFTPETLTFKVIGRLNCASSGGAVPTSMAVDRQGTAWVLLSDGDIYKVAVKDASCSNTAYAAGQSGFMKFGMGFSTNGATASDETLFVSDHYGKGLAKLDTNTLQLTTVGPYTGMLAGVSSELTGTGDGKLYGFFTTLPNATVAEIDKNTGGILSMNTLANTPARTAWAFSFYAGVFYVYTAGDPASGLPKDSVGSDVTLFDPKAGTAKIVRAGIGFRIVGAGVSTCVPTSAVK